MKSVRPIHIFSAGKVTIKSIFNKNFHASLFQEWKGLKIQVLNSGTVNIGKRLKTRGNDNLLIDHGKLVMGDYCFLNYNVSITCVDRIEIGNHVQIANNVVIVDHDHDYKELKGLISERICIEDNVWIGANSIILKGVHIGRESVIAAGSIVNKDVPSKCVVGGQPARLIKYIE